MSQSSLADSAQMAWLRAETLRAKSSSGDLNSPSSPRLAAPREGKLPLPMANGNGESSSTTGMLPAHLSALPMERASATTPVAVPIAVRPTASADGTDALPETHARPPMVRSLTHQGRYSSFQMQQARSRIIPWHVALRSALTYGFAFDNWRCNPDPADMQQDIVSTNENLSVVAALILSFAFPTLLSDDSYTNFYVDAQGQPTGRALGAGDGSAGGGVLDVDAPIDTPVRHWLAGGWMATLTAYLLTFSVCCLTTVVLTAIRNINYVQLVHPDAMFVYLKLEHHALLLPARLMVLGLSSLVAVYLIWGLAKFGAFYFIAAASTTVVFLSIFLVHAASGTRALYRANATIPGSVEHFSKYIRGHIQTREQYMKQEQRRLSRKSVTPRARTRAQAGEDDHEDDGDRPTGEEATAPMSTHDGDNADVNGEAPAPEVRIALPDPIDGDLTRTQSDVNLRV